MRFSIITALVFSFLLVIGAGSTLAFATPPKQGYVEYRISVFNQQAPVANFLVNESAQPTNQNGFVQLTLSLMSSIRNLTYSRALNASSLPEIFPYVPATGNQTLSYKTSGITLTVHIHNTGNDPITFDGKNYQGTNYAISASVTYSTSGYSVSASGNIVTVSSGLIYSAQLQIYNRYSLHIQLLATSLPLVDPPSSAFPLGVALFSVGIIGAVGFAAPSIFMKIRRKAQPRPPANQEPRDEKKPSYWVD